MIIQVMQRYFPNWEVPEDYGAEWIQCECPVHNDHSPSAAVSLEHDAFTCHACGYSGDVFKIIIREEDVRFSEAVRIAEAIASESGIDLPRGVRRKPRRGVSTIKRFQRV